MRAGETRNSLNACMCNMEFNEREHRPESIYREIFSDRCLNPFFYKIIMMHIKILYQDACLVSRHLIPNTLLLHVVAYFSALYPKKCVIVHA